MAHTKSPDWLSEPRIAPRHIRLPHGFDGSGSGLADFSSRWRSTRKAAGCPAAFPACVVQCRLTGSANLLLQALRQLKMMLQRREGLAGPILQVGIVAALGIALEQRHRILVRADLVRIEVRTEVLAAFTPELVELALVRTVERGRQFGLDLAAGDQALELGRGLGVVGDHLGRKTLLRRVALVLRELARLDFEHVADRRLLDEIGRAGRNTEGRVDAGFFADRLGQRGPCEQYAAKCNE